MKKILLCLTLFLGITACSKKADNTVVPASDIFMKATVGSQSMNVTGQGSPSNSQGATCVFQKSNTTFYLTGNNGVIILSMAIDKFPKSTGSFTLGDVNSGRIGNYIDNVDPAKPVNYYSKSGTITVTKFDGKTVEGTFSYTTYNNTLKKEVKVTSGEFKVPYTEI